MENKEQDNTVPEEISEDALYAAKMFERLQPEAQKAILQLLKKMSDT